MFKDYIASDLFDIKKGKRLTKANMVEGDINFIGSTSSNNGVTAKIGNTEHLHPAHTITVSYNGSVGEVFLQDEPFWASDDVNVWYPKFEVDDRALLYIMTLIKKLSAKYSYTAKWTIDKMRGEKLSLPVIESPDPDHEYTVDDIDFEYMQERIAEFEQERITELEQERIAELDAYLAASGLDDYELTDEDKAILTEDKTMREFVVGEVFEKLKSPFRGHQKKQESVSRVRTEEYSLPLINCKFGNNGIMYYGRPGDFTSYERVLGVIYNGPPTEGQTYYHEKAGVFTDAYLIGLKEQEIASREIGLYLTTALNKSIHNETRRRYSRGNKATWEGKVETDPILLPVTMNGDIDFDYMERYIRVIEKLAIADVAKYKDRLIATTKQVVGM